MVRTRVRLLAMVVILGGASTLTRSSEASALTMVTRDEGCDWGAIVAAAGSPVCLGEPGCSGVTQNDLNVACLAATGQLGNDGCCAEGIECIDNTSACSGYAEVDRCRFWDYGEDPEHYCDYVENR